MLRILLIEFSKTEFIGRMLRILLIPGLLRLFTSISWYKVYLIIKRQHTTGIDLREVRYGNDKVYIS
jgi:hypothetical protein